MRLHLHLLYSLGLAAGLLLAADVETGCKAPTPAQIAAAEQAGEQIGIQAAECVLTQAVGGQTSAAAIATTCGLTAAANVLAIVATLIAEMSGPNDAGAVVALASSMPRAQVLAALRAVH